MAGGDVRWPEIFSAKQKSDRGAATQSGIAHQIDIPEDSLPERRSEGENGTQRDLINAA